MPDGKWTRRETDRMHVSSVRSDVKLVNRMEDAYAQPDSGSPLGGPSRKGRASMTTATADESTEYLLPGQVAAILQVSPKTITRWAKEGKLSAQRTLGGHRRYQAA